MVLWELHRSIVGNYDQQKSENLELTKVNVDNSVKIFSRWWHVDVNFFILYTGCFTVDGTLDVTLDVYGERYIGLF